MPCCCSIFKAGLGGKTMEHVALGSTISPAWNIEIDGTTKTERLGAGPVIGGGKLFHILSGNLSHQIEHHLFPDLCSNRYPEVAPRVRALAARYGLPYNTGSLTRQFGTTWLKNLRLAFPGPALQRA